MDGDPLVEYKERERAAWAAGDYSRIASLLVGASRSLVDACAISAGQEVLDVAAGTGNLALLAAAEGADVVATDLSSAQVELGRARSEAEGFDVEWLVADVEALPFEDARFDCCASAFGAMLAPRPEVAAREMFRVVRPGGTVGLTVWGRYGSQGETFEALAKYAPRPPDGVPQTRDWGDEAIAERRLGPLASSLEMRRRRLHWEWDSFEAMWETLQAAGPAAAARARQPAEVLEQAKRDVRAITERHNQGNGGRIVVEPEYLEIVARKRG